MEVNAIASMATAMEQTKTAQEVSVAVLKKALDSQASTASALLDALPPVTANLPPHLGQNINTKA
ncbi:putative motility protein YjfB-like [Paucimonas lemoignei]|uniref:Putative motility protein YjfB-like n=1 Tax=Paucimonas lemoignei TaxID=29443 RepID=A0A4R3HY02_PAULE|nr:YjfB family protein [Paucimonas lemoignei]TCS37513.1 putative motility protein YjfB-like [Paucimonas lemoignei]